MSERDPPHVGMWRNLGRAQKVLAVIFSTWALMVILGTIVQAFGLGPLNLPAEQLKSFRLRVDTLASQVDTLRREIRMNRAERVAQMDSLREWIRPIMVGECLDRTDREIQLMRLHCRAILEESRR